MIKSYLCNFVTVTSNDQVIERSSVVVIVDDGVIVSIDDYNSKKEYESLIDYSKYIMIPAFSDLHSHVAQLEISGIGYELGLDTWFKEVLYPAEKKYDDGDYKNINQKFINKLWENGVLLASVFGSINPDAVIDLMNQFDKSNLTLHVGKMNADYSGFNDARESTEDSIIGTIKVIEHARSLSTRVQAQIMPEFIPTCSSELLYELGKLAEQYNLVIHTHFAEGNFDNKMVNARFPDMSYAEVYKKHGLIRKNQTLLVHGVSSDEKDLRIMKENDCLLVHCPTALSDNPSDKNINIPRLIESGVKVGYGSDIGGSGSFNPFNNLVAMVRYSNILSLENKASLDFWDAFKIITKNNGSYFGKYGSIETGMNFSVLILTDNDIDISKMSNKEKIQRIAYDNQISSIKHRYHDGNLILKPFSI